MPLMRLACTALERVPLTHSKIIEHHAAKRGLENTVSYFFRTVLVFGLQFSFLTLAYILFIDTCIYRICKFNKDLELLEAEARKRSKEE